MSYIHSYIPSVRLGELVWGCFSAALSRLRESFNL